MQSEIYEYLKEFGFSKEFLNNVGFENEAIYFLNLAKTKENINFFFEKGLSNIEIIDLFNTNCFNLTLSAKRKKEFEEIYINKLNLSNDEIRKLLKLNNNMYTNSPIELGNIINYLNDEKKYSMESIKNLIISNPEIINKKLNDIKEK